MIREESRDNAGGGSGRINWTGRFVATIPVSVHSRFSISSRDRRRHDRLREESQTGERCLTFSLARLVSTSEWLRFRNAFTGGHAIKSRAEGDDRSYVLRGSRDASASPRTPFPSFVFRLLSFHSILDAPRDERRSFTGKSTTRRAHIVKRYQRRWRFILEIVGSERDGGEFNRESGV